MMTESLEQMKVRQKQTEKMLRSKCKNGKSCEYYCCLHCEEREPINKEGGK